MEACRDGRVDLVKLCVGKGADSFEVDGDGKPAIDQDHVREEGYEECVHHLEALNRQLNSRRNACAYMHAYLLVSE